MKNLIYSFVASVSLSVWASDDYQISREELVKKLDGTELPRRGEDGKIKGFQMMKIEPGSIYDQLGIQSGDIVVSANGEPVDSIQQAQKLHSKDISDLVILRDGKEIRLK